MEDKSSHPICRSFLYSVIPLGQTRRIALPFIQMQQKKETTISRIHTHTERQASNTKWIDGFLLYEYYIQHMRRREREEIFYQ